MSDDTTTVEETDAAEEAEPEHQTVVRMPPETTVGPLFPSGMSAPEAGLAGATAGMSDTDKESLEEHRKLLGDAIGPAGEAPVDEEEEV